jgi:hypothetical protein
MTKIVAYTEALRYDGTNGAAIVAATGGDAFSIQATGSMLRLSSCGNEHVVRVGDWVRYANGCVQQVLIDSDLHARWLTEDDIAAL